MPLPTTDGTMAAALDAHCARLAGCRACGLADGVQPILSTARAPRAMLVGQAPGNVEMGGGKPFAGRAGRTLFRWLERAGFDERSARETLYISAMTRCYPGPHVSGRGDRVPSPAERATCAHWLSHELQIIRPSVILPVGRLAIDRFLGPAPLNLVVGRSHDVGHEGGHSIVIPLPHPSGASSWVNVPAHRALLDQALELVREHLGRTITPVRSVA